VLSKNGLKVPKTLVDNIRPYIDMLRAKRLDVYDPRQFAQAQRFFAIESHRMAKDDEIRPYPVVWGGKLFIAVDKMRTPAARKYLRALQKGIATGALVSNRDVWLPSDPLQSGIHLRLFKDKQAAITLLTKLAEKVRIPNYDETLKYLAALKSAKMLKQDPLEDEDDVEETVRVRRGRPIEKPVGKAAPKATGKKNEPKPAPRTTQIRTTKPAAPTPTAKRTAPPVKKTGTAKPAVNTKKPAAKVSKIPGAKKGFRF
jgi:hypothetical protein